MYTATQITALKDERETLLNEYYKHMQTCAECFNRYAVDYGTSEPITTVCPIGAVVADELNSITDALGWNAPDYTELTTYYTDEDDQPEDRSDLVADYVVTSSERDADRWDLLPDVSDAWSAEMVLSAARMPADAPTHLAVTGHQAETPRNGNQPVMLGEDLGRKNMAWIDHELQMNVIALVDEEATSALHNSLLRIWQTPRGEIGIYKTFISNVTEETFDAYCAPCKRRLVLARTTKNVIRTVLHAHTHVPGSQVEGSDEHIIINGSDANPVPGDTDTDIKFVLQAGQWYMEQEKARARMDGTYSNGPTKLYTAWREFTESLKATPAS
jgi:hypothetical protein